ncbi:MAG: ParB/RepB/Spo0J family partition protein [Defluviitaleaceae bacterium]|nr:ParB/RepB/Spo0J family partition protein [Defluviitaleaceae bacterium]
MNELKINHNFKNLIPSLSREEYLSLTESILAHGCRDAIKVWRGIIVDGHNRYAICREHGIPFETAKVRFSTRNDAVIWIIENQMGRRNITDAIKISVALQKTDLLRKKASDSSEPVNLRKSVAKDAGVSENTVRKYMKIREFADPNLLAKVHSGKKKIGTAYCEVNSSELWAHRDSVPEDVTGLMVTTKTIEPLSVGDIPSDINDPAIQGIVKAHIAIVSNLYRFISDNAWLICDGGDITCVAERLGGQLGATVDLTS